MSNQHFVHKIGTDVSYLGDGPSNQAIQVVSKEILEPGEKFTAKLFRAGARMCCGEAQLRVVTPNETTENHQSVFLYVEPMQDYFLTYRGEYLASGIWADGKLRNKEPINNVNEIDKILPSISGPFDISIWLMEREPIGILLDGATGEVIPGTACITVGDENARWDDLVPLALNIALEFSRKRWDETNPPEDLLTKRVEKLTNAYNSAQIPVTQIVIKPRSGTT